LTQIRNNHGNLTQIVQSQVARKPEGQQYWPPSRHNTKDMSLEVGRDISDANVAGRSSAIGVYSHNPVGRK